MKSRIRITTIIFSLSLLTISGLVPYTILNEKGLAELNVATVTSLFLILLFIGGIFAIFWLTLVVKIDHNKNYIIFFYPFRLKKTKLKFEEILGFRFKYLSGKIDYKALQIKSKSGHKYTFSDFETANLREFENYFIKHLELRRGSNFTKLNDKSKEFEIQKSREFDFEQAKEIRFILYAGILICFLYLGSIIKQNFEKNNEIKTSNAVEIIIITIILIYFIIKLRNTIQKIKNGV